VRQRFQKRKVRQSNGADTGRLRAANAALPLPGASYISALSAKLRFAGFPPGHVAEWLRSGLQNRLRRFNSGRGLQLPVL
jgi:hypothetical protein